MVLFEVVPEKRAKFRYSVFYKEGVLKNLAKLSGKRLCQSLFFSKVGSCRSQTCNFIQKETLTRVFPCEFC